MKQILQNLGNGETMLAEVPRPARSAGTILVQSTNSLVSLGTERMLVEFGRSGWIAKARSQPDKVKQVLQKIKTDGLWTTVDAVRDKLDQPITLGYCNVGRVHAADSNSGFQLGQRVVSNGPHAEFVVVPHHLACAIPDSVSDQQASFTIIGAIGLQGIRLLQPTLGERFVVVGLGLIGIMAARLLKASGCDVLGVDLDPEKIRLAESSGIRCVNPGNGQDPVAAASAWSDGIGVDGVLITASTKSDLVVHQAAEMCRQRGRIVLVGVVGLNLRRADFYEKELTFQVSCSYGPGRYDNNYEQLGVDYPIGFVRWTEQRNFQAVLQMMAAGKLPVEDLISHQFNFDDALSAYELVGAGKGLGILLNYPEIQHLEAAAGRTISLSPSPAENKHPITKPSAGQVRVSMIGAGGFSKRTLLPALKSTRAELRTVVSKTGVSGTHAAQKFGFRKSSTDIEEVLADPTTDAVLITTAHNSHATLVQKAWQAGKHVFVEKPLAMSIEELESLRATTDNYDGSQLLMVGYNRRFSPHTQQLKKWLQPLDQPKSVVITVNAGQIPADHWTQDKQVGGGRIIGEACHFIDLARHLVGHPIVTGTSHFMGGYEGRLGDCASLQLRFADDSIATIHYFSNGDRSFPKERVEVFASGRIMVTENFRRTYGYGVTGGLKTRRQDKGHAAEMQAFVDAVSSGRECPIPMCELFESAYWAIRLANDYAGTPSDE